MKKNFNSRDQQVRAELTEEEVISLLKTKYQQQYYPNANLDVWDQLLVCESLAESTPIKQNYYKEKERENENVSVNWNGNDSSNQQVNFELSPNKLQIIAKLKQCNYLTPPKIIAELLLEFFQEWKSKEGHWLYVGQNWTPRPIYRVIDKIIKVHNSGTKTLQNPSAYFTLLINFRKKRKRP